MLGVEIDSVRAGYGKGADVVGKQESVTLNANPGTVTCLLGPNGCGKSTLLKTVNKLLSVREGAVRIGGDDIAAMSARAIALRAALLPQNPQAPEGLKVYELVARGRHPHRKRFGGLNVRDHEAIEQALDVTSTALLAEQQVDNLSGGQRQRVWFAMALAQDCPVLLLDEPTTYLDPAHAIDVLELAKRQAREGKTVIMVLHDLLLAGQYSDTLVLMKDGGVHAIGTPREVLNVDNLREVYGLRAEVWEDPHGHAPVIVPRGTQTFV